MGVGKAAYEIEFLLREVIVRSVICRCLVVNKMERELVDRVREGHPLATTRFVNHIVDGRGAGESLGCILEIIERLDYEGSAIKLILAAFGCTVHEGLGSRPAIVDLWADSLQFLEAKVMQEPFGFGDVLVGVVDVSNTHQVDLA